MIKQKSPTRTPKAPTRTEKEPEGYAGHIPGSRKGDVHRAFDTKGEDAAFELGQKLGLKDGTLKSWFGSWRRNKRATPDKGGKGKADKAPAPDTKPLKAKLEEMKARAPGEAKGVEVVKVGTGKRQTVRRAA